MSAAVQFDQSNAAGAIFGTGATETFYFVDAAAPNSSEGNLQIGGSAPGVATMGTGWVLGTAHASNEYSSLVYNSISAATHWSTTVGPAATPGATSCFRTSLPRHGQYPAGSWSIKLAALMTVAGTSGNANYRIRVFRSTSVSGAGATEITTATIALTTFAIATITQQNTTATWSAPRFALNNEYLFFSISLEIVAGAVSPIGATAQIVQDGTNSVITSTVFQPSILQSDHTVCFFFRSTTNTATFSGIYQYANNVGDGSLGALVALGSDGKTLGFSPPNGAPTITGVVVDLNKWYFCALVISKNGTVQTLYWKSVGAPALSFASATSVSITYVPMGVWWSSNIDLFPGSSNQDGFVGQLAGARLWSGVALTASQLEIESRQTQPAMLRGLTAQWDFENDFGGRYFDKAGNGLNIAENLPAGAIRYVAGPQIPNNRKAPVPLGLVAAAPQVAQASSSDEAFGSSSLSVQLFMYGIASDESFGRSLAADSLSIYGIVSAESVAAGAQSSALALPSIASEERAAVNGAGIVAGPPSIASDESVGQSTATDILSIYGISSVESVAVGALSVTLSPSSISSSESVSIDSNADTDVHPPSIPSDESLSLSMVSDTLIISGIASAESVSVDGWAEITLSAPAISSDESVGFSTVDPPPPPPPPVPPAPSPVPVGGGGLGGNHLFDYDRKRHWDLFEVQQAAPLVEIQTEEEKEEEEKQALTVPGPAVVVVEVEKIVYVPVKETVVVVEKESAPVQNQPIIFAIQLESPAPPPVPKAPPVATEIVHSPINQMVPTRIKVVSFGVGFLLGLIAMHVMMPVPAPNPEPPMEPLPRKRRRRRRKNRYSS